ncbi:hypothetical protein [Haloparvum sp. AD34]
MVSYYDKILFAIPVVLLLGASTSIHPSVGTFQGLGAGGVLATIVFLEATVRNPPIEPAEVTAGIAVGIAWILGGMLYVCGGA